MRKTYARVKGVGYIFWQTRHMVYHVMLGLLWAWYLRERWAVFNPVWLWIAAFGSVLPDVDHLNYFLGYGRGDTYTKQVFSYIRYKEWQKLFYFLASEHKHNTSLAYHNIYSLILLVICSFIASFVDWQAGVVLFGAMVSHYLFDIADDFVQLGELNPNWKRWGRPKKIVQSE